MLQLTPQEIQNYILTFVAVKEKEELAKELQVSRERLAGNYVALKRNGLLNDETYAYLAKITKEINNCYKEVETKNNYTNSRGSYKQQARIIMMRAIAKSGVSGTILSLPHIACAIEKMVMAQCKNNDFIGCELDKQTFVKMTQTIANERLPIEPYNGKIGDKIYGVESNTYASMLLDYCGTVNTFGKEIEYAINNDVMKVNGAMCVTVSKNGFQSTKGTLKGILDKFPKDMFKGMCKTEVATKLFFQNLIEKTNGRYVIETCFDYQDAEKDENGKIVRVGNNVPKLKTPMLLLIIRRIK
jgi:hypothetical protein